MHPKRRPPADLNAPDRCRCPGCTSHTNRCKVLTGAVAVPYCHRCVHGPLPRVKKGEVTPGQTDVLEALRGDA